MQQKWRWISENYISSTRAFQLFVKIVLLSSSSSLHPRKVFIFSLSQQHLQRKSMQLPNHEVSWLPVTLTAEHWSLTLPWFCWQSLTGVSVIYLYYCRKSHGWMNFWSLLTLQALWCLTLKLGLALMFFLQALSVCFHCICNLPQRNSLKSRWPAWYKTLTSTPSRIDTNAI